MRTPSVSAEELASVLAEPSTVIVDCRFSLADPEAGRRAYLAGHVPGAVYAHLDDDLSGPKIAGKTGRHPLPDPDRLRETLGGWGIGEGVNVVVYDDMGGAMAARLWWLLRWLGHDAVSVLDGGWPAWLANGGASSSEPPTRTRASFVPRVRPELCVDADEVARLLQRSDHRLLDARASERFRGEVEPIDPVAGHIPGARSLPLGDNLDAGKLRDPDAIRTRFARELGDVPAARAVAYCGSGVTACHLILAAEHAGLPGLRLYPGSWSEWIVDESRPVARGDESKQ
jgi:thiosulfate/3-mercaptopyruvate sulfurtransferase